MTVDGPASAAPAVPGARSVRLARRFDASPERAFRAFADPEELGRWFAPRLEGSLATGARSWLIWPDRRVWWDVTEAHPNDRFAFRWSWGQDDALVTTVKVSISPAGYGTRVEIEDGPFPIARSAALDAWAEAIEGWAGALAMVRAYLDFSVDIRPRG
jgi:uncharacterized protein YndB with AHSA1/START domain